MKYIYHEEDQETAEQQGLGFRSDVGWKHEARNNPEKTGADDPGMNGVGHQKRGCTGKKRQAGPDVQGFLKLHASPTHVLSV